MGPAPADEEGSIGARPASLRWAVTLLGCGVLLFAWRTPDQSPLVRGLMALGGVAIIALAPAVARSLISSVRLTEAGVTGPGFLGPVHIPWTDVVRVFDDVNGITIQSSRRSTRIELSTVTLRSTFGAAHLANFADTEAVVRFVLAHIPKSALFEMRYWLPT